MERGIDTRATDVDLPESTRIHAVVTGEFPPLRNALWWYKSIESIRGTHIYIATHG